MSEHLFETLVAYAVGHGARDLANKPGCWEREIDERWFVAFNAHASQNECSRGNQVPPRSFYVEFNGWPAGVIDMAGWTICAGSLANESSFRDALARDSAHRDELERLEEK